MKQKGKDRTTESGQNTTSKKIFFRTLIWFVLSWAILIPSLIIAENYRIAHPGKAWPWDNLQPIQWFQFGIWIGELNVLLSGLKLYYINEAKKNG